MYNFFLSIYYYFVGKPKIIKYVGIEHVNPDKLKYGLVDNTEYLYQYFIEELVYFFWGDFLEGRPGRQIETYQEKILVATRWNQVETGYELLTNNILWFWRNDFFYTWNQDWGDELILAVETTMAFDFLTNMFMWYIAFFYVFYIYWSNYFTFSIRASRLNFFDAFHQTEDQYFDYYQHIGKDSYNIFEDGINIVPSWFMSEYDSMTTQDEELEDHEYMDPADFCDHPSEESDRFLDYMFDARGYVHYDLYESLMDATTTHRYAHAEDRLEELDIIYGFENTSLISSFWWDEYDAVHHTFTFDQYTWQFKESRERAKHPYFFYHPLEHYNGVVDPWIMMELTWDYEPWLEDNFSVVIMGDVLVEELVLAFINTADGLIEELVDEIEEENDYDYMDFEGLSVEDNEIEQLVHLPLFREYELIPVFDEVGNKSNRVWMPSIDWMLNFDKDPDVWDWEDWEELFDEGSDGMYSDNDVVLEDAYMVALLSNDLEFQDMAAEGYYTTLLPINDITEELDDVYIDKSTEFFMRDLMESFLPYGRNEERLYLSLDQLSEDYSFVPLDRIFRHVSIWEFGNSFDYMLGEYILDASAFSVENYGVIKTLSYQINIIYEGLRDLLNGKVPEYPIRWNNVSLFYEVFNVETYTWVKLEEALRYLVLDLELTYSNSKYFIGYAPDLLIKWGMFENRKFFGYTNLFHYKNVEIFIIFLYYYFYNLIDVFINFILSNLKIKSYGLLFNLRNFLQGNFYSNFAGFDLLAYDKSYNDILFKSRCAFRLDLETVPQEEELYPSWWARQGIIDQDFYMLNLNSFDPRNPLTRWYDRAEVMTYPDTEISSCGNLDMVEIINPEYLVASRKYDPYLSVGFSLDLKFYDYAIFTGFYERDPSHWAYR